MVLCSLEAQSILGSCVFSLDELRHGECKNGRTKLALMCSWVCCLLCGLGKFASLVRVAVCPAQLRHLFLTALILPVDELSLARKK